MQEIRKISRGRVVDGVETEAGNQFQHFRHGLTALHHLSDILATWLETKNTYSTGSSLEDSASSDTDDNAVQNIGAGIACW